ncbi:MAG: porin [Opitutus sp.]
MVSSFSRLAYKTICTAIAVLSMASPLLGQMDTSLEQRLNALERKVQSLAQENSELKSQLGWKGKVAPVMTQPAGKEAKLSVGGFLQGQAEFGQPADSRWNGTKDRFFFRRARIVVAGSFAEDFDFKAEIDLQGNTLSAATGQLTRANEIFINWRKYAFANVRFGQLKPAFGAEALLSDTKMLTIERSLSSDRLADGRQIALAVMGELFNKKVSYLAMVANGNGANVSANDNSKFQKSARVTFVPVANDHDKVSVGVDGLWTRDVGVSKSDFGLTGNLFSGSREMAGLDGQWSHGPFEVTGEWLHGTFRPTGSVPATQFSAEGWQATAAWFVLPAKLQLVLREEQFDPNTATSGNTVRTSVVGFNYLIKGDDLKLSLNYLIGNAAGNAADANRFLARVQVVY